MKLSVLQLEKEQSEEAELLFPFQKSLTSQDSLSVS